ncbi:UNVERIFIED_CONTAM: hypothetical protein Q9R71_15485 [Actinomycetes bacterium ARC8]|uniref:hypothetical protein n=1 Tax=Glutamicibacter arilaitensis TaxID=256701 RepID=UPI0029377C5C|nr:hypothetical protein [Actinomycetes bacterium ARC8]
MAIKGPNLMAFLSKTFWMQVWTALHRWQAARWTAAVGSAVAIALLMGLATVLIPNPIFTREIPTVWWNYPVWIITSLFSGMLLATYIRVPEDVHSQDGIEVQAARRTGRFGMSGALLGWFAVGCPVCNKLVLLALGYSGAVTWFAPVQPFMAGVALILTGAALVSRLHSATTCSISRRELKEIS